ncbi:hypothetical protein GFS03_00685 [Sulfolobus sp. E5-1-F]|uniref:hypothetical protein n=1 Tax=Sulfolobaceae TaxID=118883 RepID=UPI0012970B3E|nr:MULTISPECIES: hypothetical protein [unclassified Sulfolobus]QGA53218.1 hypothetical protein GFS03_00685 [Sulfolobus sp. E5-1-F]QGA68336.1 hypothetical protein GFS33_05860 [Sulfolobus sp. E11-6]
MLDELIVLPFIASIMIIIIILILYYIEKIKTYVGVFFIYFSLIMMITMFIGASVYLISPSTLSLAIAFGINTFIMIPLIVYFLLNIRNFVNKKFNRERVHIVIFSLLLVLNEVLMGLTFGIAQFGPSKFSTLYYAFYYSINSYWFFYPMMAEMFALYLLHYLRGLTYREVFPLIGVATFPPTIFDYQEWFYSAIIFSLGFSTFGVIFSKNFWRYVYSVLAVCILILLFNPIAYDLVIIVSMILYYIYLLGR